MFKDNMIMFEQITSTSAVPECAANKKGSDNPFLDKYENANQAIKDLYDELEDYTLAIDDNIIKNQLKHYVAFRRISNFLCIEIKSDGLLLFLKLNPDEIERKANMRDMRGIGHYGTGDLEIKVKSQADLESIRSLISKAYGS
jgi:predicted transport protein